MIKKICLVLILLLVSLNLLACQNKVGGEEKIKEISIKAFRFGYEPNAVIVKEGEKIKLKIDNIDTPHGIIIPELNLEGENELEFTADKKGEYDWYCLIPCGSGHRKMSGKLIIS